MSKRELCQKLEGNLSRELVSCFLFRALESSVPPHSAKTLARMERSLRDLTKSNRVVTDELFGGTYVPAGTAA